MAARLQNHTQIVLPPGEDPNRLAPVFAAVNEDSPLLARGPGLGGLRQSPVRRPLRDALAAAAPRRDDWLPISPALFNTSDNEDQAPGDRGLVQLVGGQRSEREAAALAIAAAGYRVALHASGAGFLAAVDHSRPCCVLLGVEAADLSGFEVQAELKRRGLLWPVIMMGRSKVGGVVLAMKNGAIDFLEAPVDSVCLLGALDVAFHHVEQVRDQSGRIAQACAAIDRLTPREREVMQGILAGLPNKLIARQLKLSVRTVEIYRATVLNKLQARSVSAIIKLAIDAGLEPLVEDWRGF